MIFEMGAATYTSIHVLISLLGLATGFVVLFGLIFGRRFDAWTAVFLAATVATSVTGFGFPFDHLLPSHIVGIISLLVLVTAITARYGFHLMQPWGRIYAVCATIALYLNMFVAVVQAFEKVPSLKALAPTRSEAPFLVAQISLLALFVFLATVAVRRSSAVRLITA